MYARFVVLHPPQRRRDHDLVKVLPLSIGSCQADRTRPTCSVFHVFHYSLHSQLRSFKRDPGDLGKDLLVVGRDKAVVYRN